MIPTSIVWSPMCIGTLVSSSTRSNTDTAIAYLLMLACVGVVLIGTGAVFLSTRERPRSDATDGALRAGAPGRV